MREGWELKKLGDVCSYVKTKYIGEHLPYIGLEHIQSHTGKFLGSLDAHSVKSSTFHFSDKHLLYGRLRPYLNKVLIPNFEGHCSSEIFPIKMTDSILREYLFYWLTSSEIVEKIDATWTGARMPRANMKEVINFEIPIPPLKEQKQIVSTLDKAFNQIDQAKANLEQNLHNAKELFQSKLNEVFSQRGEGWVEKTLGDVANTKGRIGWKGLTAKEYVEKGPLFLSVHSLNYGDYVDFSQAFHITEERYEESPEIMLQENDILICKDGAGIGKLGIVPKLIDNTTINSSLLLIRCKNEVLTKYLYYNLLSPTFQTIVYSRLSGSTTPHLYQRDIVTFPIMIPSLNKQKEVIEILDKFNLGIKNLQIHYQEKLNNLEELKKSILQKAFRGEL